MHVLCFKVIIPEEEQPKDCSKRWIFWVLFLVVLFWVKLLFLRYYIRRT